LSGLVDWGVALTFVAGGALGGLAGIGVATRLAVHRRLLSVIFAGVVLAVAIFMLVRTAAALRG
jgi:uncharacterized membrane protein YfcA